MPPKAKPKGKHFSKRTLLIAGALATVAVLAFVYWRKKQAAANAATAAYSQDTSGGLPGQNYLPATGNSGASQLGQGVSAPPPAISCPGGLPANADGTCPPPVTQPPPTQNPPPVTQGSYRHNCVAGAGPGCGGPNLHCEYRWVAGDTGGQAAPPPDCIPEAGQPSGPPNQSSTTAPGAAAVTPTADVLSGLGTAPNTLPPAVPALQVPTANADASVRLLHVTQYAGRGGNSSNPWQDAMIQPAPPPVFREPGPPPHPGPPIQGPPNSGRT